MQTLILSTVPSRGWGCEEVLEQLLRLPAEDGMPSPLQVMAPLTSRFPGVCLESGVPFVPFPAEKGRVVSTNAAAFRVSRPEGISHIHAWCSRSLETAWILSRRWGCTFSCGMHDHPKAMHHGRGRQFLIRCMLKRAPFLSCVSQSLADACRCVGFRGTMAMIPNGVRDVAPPACEGGERAVPVIGFLGMNAPSKGFSTVANWIRTLPPDQANWQLFGDVHPASRAELDGILDSFAHVSCCGRQMPEAIYPNLDVVVMPSSAYESFGMVAIEAARAGLPVVCSSVGGPEEVIVHGSTGFLYAPGAPDEGLCLLRTLLESPELSLRVGLQARERFLSEYRVETMRDRYLNFFSMARGEAS